MVDSTDATGRKGPPSWARKTWDAKEAAAKAAAKPAEQAAVQTTKQPAAERPADLRRRNARGIARISTQTKPGINWGEIVRDKKVIGGAAVLLLAALVTACWRLGVNFPFFD